MTGVTMLAFGVVFVLLLGEIDLSIGYLSGIAALTVAELQLPGSNHDYPGLVAIAIAVGVCAAIGGIQGSVVALVGVPSFVVTLAGLLIWQGVILQVLEVRGVIVIDDAWINDTATYYFTSRNGWIIAGRRHRCLRRRDTGQRRRQAARGRRDPESLDHGRQGPRRRPRDSSGPWRSPTMPACRTGSRWPASSSSSSSSP